MSLIIVDHPLAKHLLTGLRDSSSEPDRFRRLADVLSTILILEATRGVPVRDTRVGTPLEETDAKVLAQSLAVVPVLRAGMSMLEAALRLFPHVAVGYIGLERSHDTAVAHSYYCKLPKLSNRFTLLCDPMLATGGSASQAVSLLKANGATEVTMVSVVAAPEGVQALNAAHPDVTIYTAALDRCLNEQKYIVPGLGDYGDRLYGTE
ncbi:MAG TPA: uracil phosphoribosyltransferase [Fimbriimonadaceae bacterium]|nr:uracil phosphoribosyltransferase [Fimbriimonadaceae bacterium]